MTREQAINETTKVAALIGRTTLDLVQSTRMENSMTGALEAAILTAGESICMMLRQVCIILAQQIPPEGAGVDELMQLGRMGENETQQD